MEKLRAFRYWCQFALPLVYDDCLSEYEVLCKVIEYLNKVIASQNDVIEGFEELKSDLSVVQKWIADFEPDMVTDMVYKYIAGGVVFGLTESGYFTAYIPQTWNRMRFNTTGYDITLPLQPEFGHLVLSY